MAFDIFQHLKNLTSEKIPWDARNDAFVKAYDKFQISRFLSMIDLFLPLVNQVNRYPNISKEAHYNFFLSVLPKRQFYFKYIKKEKEVNKEAKEAIAEYFEIGKKEVDSYIEQLTEHQIEQIVKKFEGGKTK